MCLCKTHRWPKISFSKIPIYKQLETTKFGLISPVIGTPVEIGKAICAKKPWFTGILRKVIEGEGVHAYTDDMPFPLITSITPRSGSIVWYRGYIPPLTPYWIGGKYEIAASKIVLTEKIE